MLRDIWLIFTHQLRITMGSRAGLAFGMIQPVLNLALFGPLLTTYIGPDSWQVFVPGVLMQLALLSAGLAGFGIVFDARFGVLERQRVTPASRIALLLGRVFTNVVVLLGQSALVVAVGFAFGPQSPDRRQRCARAGTRRDVTAAPADAGRSCGAGFGASSRSSSPRGA